MQLPEYKGITETSIAQENQWIGHSSQPEATCAKRMHKSRSQLEKGQSHYINNSQRKYFAIARNLLFQYKARQTSEFL